MTTGTVEVDNHIVVATGTDHRAQGRLLLRHSVEDMLSRLSAHTLVIRGSRDPVCPHDGVVEVAAVIPDAVRHLSRGSSPGAGPTEQSVS